MSQPAHAQASRKDAWVGIVTALPAEARCLGQRVRAGARAELTPAVYLTVAGIGETRAMQAADALARDGAAGLMSFGVAGALVLGRVVESLLFGVTARDIVTFTFVPAALALVAVLASYLPARRASRIDPTEALRAE